MALEAKNSCGVGRMPHVKSALKNKKMNSANHAEKGPTFGSEIRLLDPNRAADHDTAKQRLSSAPPVFHPQPKRHPTPPPSPPFPIPSTPQAKPPSFPSHPQPEPAQRLRLAPPRLQAEVALRVRRGRHPRLVRAPQRSQRPGHRRRCPPEGRLVRGVPRFRAVLAAQLGAPLPRVQQAAGAPGGIVAKSEPRAAQALGLAAEAAPAEVALGVRRRDGLGQDVLSSSFYPAFGRVVRKDDGGRGGEESGEVISG